jgi:hypothetical protein
MELNTFLSGRMDASLRDRHRSESGTNGRHRSNDTTIYYIGRDTPCQDGALRQADTGFAGNPIRLPHVRLLLPGRLAIQRYDEAAGSLRLYCRPIHQQANPMPIQGKSISTMSDPSPSPVKIYDRPARAGRSPLLLAVLLAVLIIALLGGLAVYRSWHHTGGTTIPQARSVQGSATDSGAGR